MSIAQQQASRSNGAKSTGPVTSEGKTRSSQNATRHGLAGGPIVLPNESQELFDELRLSYYSHYRPTTDMECSLIEEMAEARWRMRRLSVLDTAILNQACEAELEQMGEGADQRKAMAKAFVHVAENSKAWRMLERYQRTLRRVYEKARAELDELGNVLAYEIVAAENQAAEQQAAQQQAELIRQAISQQNTIEQNEPGEAAADETPQPDSAFLASVLPYIAKQNAATESIDRKKKQNEPAKRAFAA